MVEKKIYILTGAFILMYGSAHAEFAELDQGENIFNKMKEGPGITQLPGTTGNQFKSAIFFGASSQGTKDGVNRDPEATGLRLTNTRIGAAFFGRVSNYKFGGVIYPPLVNVNDEEISKDQSIIYWNSKPYNSEKALVEGNPEYGRFYYSHGSGKVYGTSPGPVDIVWERLAPANSTPAVTGNGWTSETVSDSIIYKKTEAGVVTERWREYNSVYYQQITKTVIISGSAVKPPRTIYWSSSKYVGVPVVVPGGRISDVKVVFNNDFPKDVPADEGEEIFDSGISFEADEDSTNPPVGSLTQTLWYSKLEGAIHAANKTGRVFVELQGPTDPVNGHATFLGFEIVDVKKEPILESKTLELGEVFPVLKPIEAVEVGLDLNLIPQIASRNLATGNKFVFKDYTRTETDTPDFYGIRETENFSDLVVWWMISANQGIRWPERYVSYNLKWPENLNQYSHYIRPDVETENEAMATAVLMPRENGVEIVYQDDNDNPRALINDKKFYTKLDSTVPVHRSLIKHTSGDFVKFERVISWLEDTVIAGEFPVNNITESLGVEGDGTFNFFNQLEIPRSVNQTVYVGSRIKAPSGEIGSAVGDKYIAGKIISGKSYHPDAYVDPIISGFEAANKGAIIPVNAIPLTLDGESKNILDVLWCRRNKPSWLEGDAAAEFEKMDESRGFKAVYWPAVTARYTIKWPHEKNEYEDISADTAIVLASNHGSGPLNSLESKGSIYFQNNVEITGYNPNEEHALMQGDRVYALRNDLNLTSPDNINYSSEPYVLLYYTDEDGRPNMRAFRVLQELGDNVFDYNVVAGTILQAPMPLPLLEKVNDMNEYNGQSIKKVEKVTNHDDGLKITFEQNSKFKSGDLIYLSGFINDHNNGWAVVDNYQTLDGSTDKKVIFVTCRQSTLTVSEPAGSPFASLQKPPKSGSYANATINDRKNNVWVYRGPHNSEKKPAVGANSVRVREYHGISGAQTSDLIQAEKYPDGFDFQTEAGYFEWPQTGNIDSKPSSVRDAYGVEITGYIHPPETSDYTFYLSSDNGSEVWLSPNRDPADQVKIAEETSWTGVRVYKEEGSATSLPIALEAGRAYSIKVLMKESAGGDNLSLAWSFGDQAVALTDLKPIRGEYLSRYGYLTESPDSTFKLSFYYKTLDGFAFPGSSSGVEVGTLVPYLLNDVNSEQNYNDFTAREPLGINYSSVWPTNAPELRPGQTLTTSVFGLPAVRGNTSLRIIYQESKANSNSDFSVTLHDPTREKVFDFNNKESDINKIPDSIVTSNYKGKTYFPQLPPHLVNRFFFDPNRGELGSLVFRGEFVDDIVGEDYLLMNVLSAADMDSVVNLSADPGTMWSGWKKTIENLTAEVETFIESDSKKGQYEVGATSRFGSADLVLISSSEIAVDSYALTANGTKGGYVTLIAGNGRAFTPKDEPVQMHVIKVGGELYQGETKVILSDNPLGEKVTFMHTADLAGKTADFDYEWRISAPEDGLPPAINERSLFNELTAEIETTGWKHFQSPIHRVEESVSANLGQVVVQEKNAIIGIDFVSNEDEEDKGNTDSILIKASAPSFFAGDKVDLVGFSPANLNIKGLKVKSVKNGLITLDIPSVEGLEVQSLGVIQESIKEVDYNNPASILRGSFTIPAEKDARDMLISLNADSTISFSVKFNQSVVVNHNMESVKGFQGVDTPVAGTSDIPDDFNPLSNSYLIDEGFLSSTGTNNISVELWSSSDAGADLDFDLKIEAYNFTDKVIASGSKWLKRGDIGSDLRSIILGESADVQALGDNYVIMRYRSKNSNHMTRVDNGGGVREGWSNWTEPQLAEGWIKRVLAGINPFSQRATDLFSNSVDTTSSILTQAGKRWEGDVALNMDNINDYGLIEIYETVMGRGKMLSIDAGIDYGPANDALLLAAGYINDLYMMLGNEAWADAANPTIAMGSHEDEYKDIATSLFAFKGQLPSLLEEELALLRGRDDFLQPGVETGPVYNRLFWNFTRGIDSGEVIYALNYNIKEEEADGKINAEDAYHMYPQGHGDAYGHYLTALKGYYKLLLDNDFSWVPRAEAVTILGKPVSVDYFDERKFAAAAAAIARTGKQVFDLTWRKDYDITRRTNWEKEFYPSRQNNRRTHVTNRNWGMDHWASRTGQGALINWVVGNSMLPDEDLDPDHSGIQRIDRTTVPELRELTTVIHDLQVSMDNAEAGLNPLRLNENTVLMDINPNKVSGEQTHFDLILERAENALSNAASAFNDTKDITSMLRGGGDSFAEFKAGIDSQELAYKYELIELYGTPYPDDIGPGKTYKQGYDGPDLFHYMYTDSSRLEGMRIPGHFTPDEEKTFKIDLQRHQKQFWNTSMVRFDLAADSEHGGDVFGVVDFFTGKTMERWFSSDKVGKDYRQNEILFDIVRKNLPWDNFRYDSKYDTIDIVTGEEGPRTPTYIEYTLSPLGYAEKPANWKSRRSSPGEIQNVMGAIGTARDTLDKALMAHKDAKYRLDRAVELFEIDVENYQYSSALRTVQAGIEFLMRQFYKRETQLFENYQLAKALAEDIGDIATEATPKSVMVGFTNGGDMMSPADTAFKTAEAGTKQSLVAIYLSAREALNFMDSALEGQSMLVDMLVDHRDRNKEVGEMVLPLDLGVREVNGTLWDISDALDELQGAKEAYRAIVSKGMRIQNEREVFRKDAAALTQGYRTKDAAFRIFRNEKLERYKALQDVASQYAFLAAQAYDYETGLLGTDDGKRFLNKIINSRALGVVIDGVAQFAGSDAGDPGVSSALAEMKVDWGVVKRRLGFNNPDLYATTASLRSEKYRILPGLDGSESWSDVLERARHHNILSDHDVRRHCMQIEFEDGRPVPGLIIEFETVIQKGKNIFGLPLSGGDSQFSSSSFAHKIMSAGIVLDGYIGMASSNANDQGGISPSNPTPPWLDPNSLSKTPYVYLIPVGVDLMRSPALGDTSHVRSWNVNDVAIPLPFNIGGSDNSSKKLWQSSESLTDNLFAVRKHQPFRAFDDSSGIDTYMNSRLIGRSVWNSKWKIVIPGYTLFHDPEEGLDRFIQSVKDIKVHFNTYSYSGN